MNCALCSVHSAVCTVQCAGNSVCYVFTVQFLKCYILGILFEGRHQSIFQVGSYRKNRIYADPTVEFELNALADAERII